VTAKKIKLILFGSSGVLGRTFRQSIAYDSKYELISLGSSEYNVLNDANLECFLADICPDIIINCASLNGINVCSRNKHNAYKINGIFPQKLGTYSSINKKLLVHFSSECVFEDCKYLIENTIKPPVNNMTTYGLSKLLGEIQPTKWTKLIRLPLLISKKRNQQIIWKILNQLEQGSKAKASIDVMSSPVKVENIVHSIMKQLKIEGLPDEIIHFSCNRKLSVYETTKELGRECGIDTSNLMKANDSEFPSLEQKPLELGLKASHDFSLQD